MTFLTEGEISIYVPSFSGDGALLAILQAQAAIEAFIGYDLEQQERVEILKLTQMSRTTQLNYWPIADSPAPVMEVREGNINDSFLRDVPLTNWYTLQSSDYVLDSTGLLTVNTADTSLVFGRSTGRANYVRATYTAGIDFTADSTEVKLLKASVGQIITYQQSEAFTSGASSIDIDDFYRVEYGTGSASPIAGNIPEQLFGGFKKYRARSSVLFA